MSKLIPFNFVTNYSAMKRYLLPLFIFVLIAGNVLGQDARFSQIWAFPTMLNPALSGKFDGKIRTSAGYSYQNTDVGTVTHQFGLVDQKFLGKGQNKDNYFGAALSYYQYGTNAVTPITGRFVALSGAYHMNITPDGVHSMGLGTQLAIANGVYRKVRETFQYDKEISGGGFRYTNVEYAALGSAVASGENKKTYLDWNAGAYYKYSGDNITFEAGLGAYHFLHPKNSVAKIDPESKLRARFTFHTSMNIALSDEKSILVQNIYWKEGLYWASTALDANNLITNWAGFEYQTNPSKDKFYANYGLYTRSFKTYMPYISLFSPNGLNLRFSIESPINAKKFEVYTAKRVEVGIGYTFQRTKNTKRIRAYVNTSRLSEREAREKEERDAEARAMASSQYTPPSFQQNQGGMMSAANQFDMDGDGISNNLDRCPTQFGTLANSGCPFADADGDGVLDHVDACPLVPGSPRNGGCPEDNVVNTKQIKPTTPDPLEEQMGKDTLRYNIYFETGKYTLSNNSFDILNKVVHLLKSNEDYRCVLTGHTDIEGISKNNILLSQTRATVAQKYLMSYGVDDKRVQIKYYGDTQPVPIFGKDYEWMNRRVEVVLIKLK